MRRYVTAAAASALLASLAIVTVLSARSVDATALGRARAVEPSPAGVTIHAAAATDCRVEAVGIDAGVPSLTVAGPCTGHIAGLLDCAYGDEAVDGSLQVAPVGGPQFTLTVVVPDYAGPGRYDEADLFAQVARPDGAARWSVRGTTVSVDRSGRFAVSAALTPEPGTATGGTLQVRGVVRCRNSA